MREKNIWSENRRSEAHESDAGGMCAIADSSCFSSDRTLDVTQQNTSVPNPWQMQRRYHLSTPFSPDKREHLPSLISLPPRTI